MARLVPDHRTATTPFRLHIPPDHGPFGTCVVSWELCQYGPEDHFQNRVASIAQRMQAVLKRQWSPTRYEQGGPAEAAVSVLGQLVACLICVSRLSQTAITDHGSSK